MAKYLWDPALETGNAVVDEQHMNLFGLLNDLSETECSDRTRVGEVLDRLIIYAATHFDAECALMESTGFPEDLALAHRAEHEDLRERTRQFVLDYREGKLSSTGPLTDFLRDWLENHIRQVDRLLTTHVQRIAKAG